MRLLYIKKGIGYGLWRFQKFPIFFFKQKTAYEIGTGDWRSDVCSSDLVMQNRLHVSTLCLRIDTIQVHCKLSLEKDTIPLYCELEWILLCMVMEKYQAFSLFFCDLSVDYINQNSKPWLDITFSYLFLCSGCKKRSVFLLLL